MYWVIRVAEMKALISFCVFVFAYAKIWFSHGEAHMVLSNSFGVQQRVIRQGRFRQG